MIAIPKSRKTKKTANPTETIPVSQPIPVPIPPVPVIPEKPPSYRQKLIEKIGIEAVREKERLSRQATKERKSQAIPVA
jgi:hypothetical protein